MNKNGISQTQLSLCIGWERGVESVLKDKKKGENRKKHETGDKTNECGSVVCRVPSCESRE